MAPGTQVIVFHYQSWGGNCFGLRRISKEDYFAFCQHLTTFEKEEMSISVPVGHSHVVLKGKEILGSLQIIPLTGETNQFLDKLFLNNVEIIGFDVAGAIVSEVTWKQFLTEQKTNSLKEQAPMVEE